MKRVAAAIWLAVVLGGASLALAARLPTRVGITGPLQARPRTIDLAPDGKNVFLAGFSQQHLPYIGAPARDFGRLKWTEWNASEGIAAGGEWIDPCTTSCGGGTYTPRRATIRVFDPDTSGIFQDMTVKAGHRTTHFYAADINGSPDGWHWTR